MNSMTRWSIQSRKIFKDYTLSQLNSTNFTMSQIDTVAFGRCFTICPQRKMDNNEFLTMHAKRKFDLKMILHPALVA